MAGSDCGFAVKEAAEVAGVAKVLVADNEVYAHQLAENVAALAIEIAADYDVILAPATGNGKNILPRVAALLDVQMISEIISVESSDTFKRPIYAGNVIATVQSGDSKKVITVRATAFDAVEASGGSAEVVSLEQVTDAGVSSFVSEELAVSDRPELTAANIVVSGGRGMQNGDNFKLIEAVADKLNTAMGASRGCG